MSLQKPLREMRIRRQSPNNTFGRVRTRPDGTTKPHQGWDLYAAVGTPAYAVSEGHIVQVQKEESGDYGRSVTLAFLEGGKWHFAFYAHLSEVSVSELDIVRAGQQVGRTGKTGNASGLSAGDHHLHFEIRTQWKVDKGLGGRIDPGDLLGYEVYSSQP